MTGKKTKRPFPLASALTLALSVAIVLCAVFGLRSARAAQQQQARRVLEDSLRRAAVSCYAIEGMFPDTLDYLTAHYGVYIDEARFQVYYQVFASNIMPDITVLEK